MILEKVLILDSLTTTDPADFTNDLLTLKPRVAEGFMTNDIPTVFDIESDPLQLTATDTMHIITGCTIPRMKVTGKFTRVMDPTKATVAFINTDFVGESKHILPARDYLQLGKTRALDVVRDLKQEHCENVVKSILNTLNIDKVLLSKEACTSYAKIYNSSDRTIADNTEVSRWSLRDVLTRQTVFNIVPKDSGLRKMKAKIFSQNALLEIINNEGMTLDNEKYNELKTLFNTGDDDNITLAMELMANANVETGFANLVFLILEFHSKIGNNKAADHINFKSLMAVLGFTKHMRLKQCFEIALEQFKLRNILTSENILRLGCMIENNNCYPDNTRNIRIPDDMFNKILHDN